MRRKVFRLGCVSLLLVGCSGCTGGDDASQDDRTPVTSDEDSATHTIPPLEKYEPKRMVGPGDESGKPSVDYIPPLPPFVSKEKENESKGLKESAPETSSSGAVSLDRIDFAGYTKKIADRNGKVIVVDFWATWCLKCVEKFPKFIELSKKFSPEEVSFLTINSGDSDLDSSLEFLIEKGARLDNFFLTTDSIEVDNRIGNLLISAGLIQESERMKYEGLPKYLIYDANGKLVFITRDTDELSAKLTEILKK